MTNRDSLGKTLASPRVFAFLLCLVAIIPAPPAYSYIGPGAGLALAGSSLVLLSSIVLALLSFLFLPFRALIRRMRGFGIPQSAHSRRVVVLGFDGMDAALTSKFMAAGKLPTFTQLSQNGCFSPLATTTPSLSPVAWSSFQTGVNPGAHNVFDFLERDTKTYLPKLVSTAIETQTHKRWLFFKRTVKSFRLTRGSQPFWHLLSKKGIPSNILRVPISFPPEPLLGNILSAMCTPDLRGSQGTFTFYSSRTRSQQAAISGELYEFGKEGNILTGKIQGPNIEDQPSSVEFKLWALTTPGDYHLQLQSKNIILKAQTFSEWLTIDFKTSEGVLSGIVRFYLREVDSEIELYITPVNTNPLKSVLPITYPTFFGQWLAKTFGLFGSLGFLEDTWARNERALDDSGFLQQATLNQAEREKMLFEVLDRSPEGLVTCVFDGTDRIQHVFWRYLETDHPSPVENRDIFSTAIEDTYVRMDQVTAKVLSKLGKSDSLIVLSDHGFGSFRRCVNLNYWLYSQGYIVLKEGADSCSDYFQTVDWSKTKAFALGLSGIYVNRIGRERLGIVEEPEAQQLLEEISEKLLSLRDPLEEKLAISKVFRSANIYRGLYAKQAPDLVIGYQNGYRVSWESITGGIEKELFSDNLKAWSGDHHLDPALIPGILLSNVKLASEGASILDLAPTILDLFGLPTPNYMDGKSLLRVNQKTD